MVGCALLMSFSISKESVFALPQLRYHTWVVQLLNRAPGRLSESSSSSPSRCPCTRPTVHVDV